MVPKMKARLWISGTSGAHYNPVKLVIYFNVMAFMENIIFMCSYFFSCCYFTFTFPSILTYFSF